LLVHIVVEVGAEEEGGFVRHEVRLRLFGRVGKRQVERAQEGLVSSAEAGIVALCSGGVDVEDVEEVEKGCKLRAGTLWVVRLGAGPGAERAQTRDR
jgi:hypothetical protein